MPLFNVELNRFMDDIGSSDLTIFLHAVLPTDASPTNGRITTGGGEFGSGATLAASDISTAVNGDISNSVHILFGTATADVGTVIGWSAYRGTAPVGYGTLPSADVVSGENYRINANSLQFNGAST